MKCRHRWIYNKDKTFKRCSKCQEAWNFFVDEEYHDARLRCYVQGHWGRVVEWPSRNVLAY